MSQGTNKKSLIESSQIGFRVKTAREARNMTQAALGDKVHLSKSEVSHLENGERSFTMDAVIRFANALQCSTDYLLRGKRGSEDLFIRINDEHFLICEYANGSVLLNKIQNLSEDDLSHLKNDLFKDFLEHCPNDLKLDTLQKMFAYFERQLNANDPDHINLDGLNHLIDSQRFL